MAKSKRATILPKRPPTIEKKSPPISPAVIFGVIALAFVIVGGLIVSGGGLNLLNRSNAPINSANFPTKGKADASVTITEFTDYGCSHCRDFEMETASLLDKDYIQTGKVKFVAHPFYLGAPEMAVTTQAAWCAADQGKFFEYHHALYENFGSYSQTALISIASGVKGLDANALAQCLSKGTHQNDVEQARQDAVSKGIVSTPIFFVNEQRIEGNQPYEKFKQVIEQELAKAGK